MRLIPFSPFKHLDYVRSVLEVPISESTSGIIALDKQDTPQGVVLLDNWTPNSCMGHIAIQHPMAMRHLPYEALRYVFQDCDRKLFLGVTPSNNVKALKFHDHLGFTEQYRIPDGHCDGVDLIILQMRREECRYLQQFREVA